MSSFNYIKILSLFTERIPINMYKRFGITCCLHQGVKGKIVFQKLGPSGGRNGIEI
jgi:hypothetical protein